MSAQTMRQRAAIHAYIEHGAQADVLARGQLKRDADSAIADFQAARLRYELARLHSQPSENVLHAAGESCCAAEADEDPALSIREDFVITVLGIAALICLAILFFLGAR